MKSFFNSVLCAAGLLALTALPLARAAGGADYGRGPETDPVALAALTNTEARLATQIGAESNVLRVAVATVLATTNGQAITISKPVMTLNSSGNTSGETNVVTLADAGVGRAGVVAWLYNVGTTNSLALAQTGNFVSPAVVAPPGGVIQVVAVATNQWAGK